MAIRWPGFRYDPDNVASNGQFTQVGAELIGSHSTLADAELLSLAAGVPAALGIADYRVRVADLDVLDGVLDTVGLSDRARSFIVANMNRISSNQSTMSATLQRAAELHIASDAMCCRKKTTWPTRCPASPTMKPATCWPALCAGTARRASPSGNGRRTKLLIVSCGNCGVATIPTPSSGD